MIPQPENIKTYPTTTAFPSKPSDLSREELEQHYLTLRGHYKGLMISRGQFAAKNRRIQTELEKSYQDQNQLVQQLTEMAKENKDLYSVSESLKQLTDRQNQLVTEFQTEYEAIKNDRSNLLDPTSFWEKFNRLMRAAYKLLNQGVMPKPVEPKPRKEDPFSTNPDDIWRDINENK
jgi:seryl-tRNA synthetase